MKKRCSMICILMLWCGLAGSEPCYVERERAVNGNRSGDRVCRIIKENLNELCDRPPDGCGLAISPRYSNQIRIPDWRLLSISGKRELIEVLFRQPWLNYEPIDEKQIFDENIAAWQLAISRGSASLAVATVDLFNVGIKSQAYRLSFDGCAKHTTKIGRDSWEALVNSPRVQIYQEPQRSRDIFARYQSLGVSPMSDVLVVDGTTYWYTFGGSWEPPQPNIFRLYRVKSRFFDESSRPALYSEQLCSFEYVINEGD